jgi:hypothetical protein|tara:strand:- start:778 stop:1017 length:240 start_codon:yes stop_codon:yes gene_type:complete
MNLPLLLYIFSYSNSTGPCQRKAQCEIATIRHIAAQIGLRRTLRKMAHCNITGPLPVIKTGFDIKISLTAQAYHTLSWG